MDFRRESNRPALRPAQAERQSTSAAAAPAGAPVPPHHINVQNTNSGKKHFLMLALATLLLLSAGFALGKFAPVLEGEYGRVDTSKHQAVFLTNDQVYFGKIVSISDDVVVMKEIYYLQKGADQTTDAKEATAPTQQSNMSLAKLGNELHAPEDLMQINKDQVLFWENLKDDGKVVQAIKAYKK